MFGWLKEENLGKNGYRWILFSDLDGTFLDKETYEPGPALDGLVKCRQARIPVIFSSSKTRAELEFYYNRYSSLPGCPFIAENGGGIFFPKAYWEKPPEGKAKGDFWCVTLGADIDRILSVLKSAADIAGMNIRNFSSMSPLEVAERTNLSAEEARLAKQREFDEPFWIQDNDLGNLDSFRLEIQKRQMRLTRGGRCFHIHGASDKGKAARYVLERYASAGGEIRSAAVGDAANDLPLMQAVDKAYLVKGADGRHDPDIHEGGRIRFLSGRGPHGFLQAVKELLRDDEYSV